MKPKIKTNWHLYTPDLEISFPSMKSWVEENNSLMNRLRLLETKIDLIVLDEQICKHHDAQTSAEPVLGNLRRILLKSDHNLVFAESFFSQDVIKEFAKFGRLEEEPLGKYLFSDSNIKKHETYIADYELDDQTFLGRKCIYSYNDQKFSVIEVFLFNE